MKNKTFISFCINVLVGILFSYPVFSSQDYSCDFTINSEESCEFVNETGCINISYVNGSSTKYYPKSEFDISSQYKFPGNCSSGNKDKTKVEYSPPCFNENLTYKFFKSQFCLNPVFVNLAYLKDLRITKMLC